MNVRHTLLLVAATAVAATAHAADDQDTPGRAQNANPWPTFQRTLSGKVMSGSRVVETNEQESAGPFQRFLGTIYGAFHRALDGEQVAPERAQNANPWPTFQRTLSGKVMSGNRVLEDDQAAPERAQNANPWPTFQRTLSGKVMSGNRVIEKKAVGSGRRLRTE